MEKRGRGRPRKSAENSLKASITVRLSPAERAIIDNRAKQSKKGLSQWVRETLLSAAKNQIADDESSGR